MITILHNGIQLAQGQVEYLWFRVHDPAQGAPFFRAVALMELASVPVSIREDYDLLQKQWAAVRGLYNARADFVYSAAGIFTPEHVGVVQYYGGAGTAGSLEEAAGLARRNLAAVRATLANYEQSRLAPPTPAWIEWYLDFITRRSQRVLALLGHPDPRQTRRGLGKDGEIANDTGDDLAAEQNELLFRGLAKLRADFVFQVTANRIGREHITRGLVRVAQVVSNVASRRRGSLNIGFNLSLPLALALSQALSGSRSAADSHSQAVTEGQSHGWGNSETDSHAHTESRSSTTSEGESHGIAIGYTDAEGFTHSQGLTTSRGHTDSQSHTESESVTHSQSHTDSRAHTESQAVSESHSTSVGHSTTQGSSSNWSQGSGTSQSEGASSTWSEGSSASQSEGTSSNWSEGSSQGSSQSASESATDTVSGSVNFGVNAGVPGVVGANVGGSVGGSHSEGQTTTTGTSQGISTSTGGSTSSSTGSSQSSSVGGSTSTSTGSSQSSSTGGGSFASESNSVTHTSGTTATRGSSDTVGSADTYGTAHSKGTARTTGSADSTGEAHSTGWAKSISHAKSVTESHTWMKSRSFTQGSADTWGRANGRSEAWGQSRSESDAYGLAVGRAVGTGFGAGFSGGLVPGISIGRSWQTEDDLADRLTEVLRSFEGQLNLTAAEGGFMTDAVLFTASEQGEAAARALVPQAFHGPNVPTPVLTVQPEGAEAQDIRDHALAFLHYPGLAGDDPLGGYLFTKYATLLTPGQLAAYTAPGLFEEGAAMTVMAPIPRGIAFYPAMPGDVLLGHQFSPETGELTTAPVRIDVERLMHTLFAGDTGWGKSVAAVTLAYESTLRWRTRSVVLDFGAGWRQLLNAPGLEGHVDILQLWPDAVRPFRWNPLQIGRHINPETQWRAFADIFGSIAKLGVRRQKQELLQALRELYLQHGVLVDDPVVRGSPSWGRVRDPEEAALAEQPAGTPLGDLAPGARQALAVWRSSRVGLADLYAGIEYKLSRVPSRDTMLTGVLEGILFRLNPLVQGSAAGQFAPGPGATPLEDLARPWGIVVIEGGIFLDDFGKAFLLGWAGWHLYTDMVARRVHEVDGEPLLQIFFEEANKIFGGVGDGGGDEESGGVSTSQRFGDMFRDARKYRCRLHVVTQAPSLIAPDIISSCNNLVAGFLKNPKDKDLVLSALARSEKGFRDEEWRRFLTNENIGMAIGRFPYAKSRELQQPFLFQPLMLTVPEPSDAEIAARLGRLNR